MPFVFIIAFALPAIFAGDWLWFRGDAAATVFVALTAGMWLAATAFVDVNRPRGPRDKTDTLISLGLIIAAPVAVIDRVYFLAARLPPIIGVAGMFISLVAIIIGLRARFDLGDAYLPRSVSSRQFKLVKTGIYSQIRHPMYAAALIWGAGWPLIISSLFGAAVALGFLAPALIRRIAKEEADLRHAFGHEYDAYRTQTKKLVPFIY